MTASAPRMPAAQNRPDLAGAPESGVPECRVVVLGPDLEVRTPYARILLVADGTIRLASRRSGERPLVTLSVGGGGADPWIVESVTEPDRTGVRADTPDRAPHAAPTNAFSCSIAAGARVRARRGALVAEIRGDGVVVLLASRVLPLTADAAFTPDFVASHRGRFLALDDEGGFGIFPVRATGGNPVTTTPAAAGSRARPSSCTASWTIPPGGAVWCTALPVRPPDPSLAGTRIAHEGRPSPWPDGAHPASETIADAARTCRVFALHAYAWQAAPWSVRLRPGRWFLRRQQWRTPRHDPALPDAFARVREDVRRNGMKFLVYFSPRWTTAADLREEAARILRDHGADGFYVDEVADDLPRLDGIVRDLRRILGPDRLLYLNASDEPFGHPAVFAPFVDAQCDFVLRGSRGTGGMPLPRFLRRVVSGHATSGAAGFWCTTTAPWPERPPADDAVRAALAAGVGVWRRSRWGAEDLARIDRILAEKAPP